MAIRCRPYAPATADELEMWLEHQVEELRAAAPRSIVGLSRLTSARADPDVDTGWLLEVELADGEPLLAATRWADTLRDMRLLGLQPTTFAPTDSNGDGCGD